MRIHVVERAEKLVFGERVAVRAVAADADAQGARRAALSPAPATRRAGCTCARLRDASGFAHVLQIAGQRILDVLVLAAAAFEDQLHFDLILVPLLEVNHRRFLAQIVAAVFAGERIDGIGPQLAAPRGFGDGS